MPRLETLACQNTDELIGVTVDIELHSSNNILLAEDCKELTFKDASIELEQIVRV